MPGVHTWEQGVIQVIKESESFSINPQEPIVTMQPTVPTVNEITQADISPQSQMEVNTEIGFLKRQRCWTKWGVSVLFQRRRHWIDVQRCPANVLRILKGSNISDAVRRFRFITLRFDVLGVTEKAVLIRPQTHLYMTPKSLVC